MEAILELSPSVKFGLSIIERERRKTDSQKNKTPFKKEH